MCSPPRPPFASKNFRRLMEELTPDELDYSDRDFDVIIGVRAVRAA